MTAMNGRETEVKFLLENLERIKERLDRSGAVLLQPRTLETNLRFDLPDEKLRKSGSALRLRKDNEARLTYKGPGTISENVISRQEIEFSVGDFDGARDFLIALGYRVVFTYEKHREIYALENSLVMLDELPFGDFVEIEAEDIQRIKSTAQALGLNWECAIPTSYHQLFRRIAESRGIDAERVTFEDYHLGKIEPGDLRLQFADTGEGLFSDNSAK